MIYNIIAEMKEQIIELDNMASIDVESIESLEDIEGILCIIERIAYELDSTKDKVVDIKDTLNEII